MANKLAFPFIAVALAAATLSGCGTIARGVTAERAYLSYVGTLSFGEPRAVDGKVTIPLAFEGGHWRANSGICFHDVKSRAGRGTLEMTVRIALCAGRPRAAEMELRDLPAGDYAVTYVDPDGARHVLAPLKIPAAGRSD
jgi:hypothetical protein